MKNKKKDYKTPAKNSLEEMFKEIDKERKEHPIRCWLRPKFWQLVRLPGDIKRNIYFFFQRGIRGYADCDTWGFSYYLSKVISGGVKYLKEINHGLPTWEEGKTELECINEWDCILNTIINTFETAKDINEGKIVYLSTSKWSDKEYRICKKIAKESKYHHKVLMKKEAKEFEKGFDYFKKYFFSLWD